MSYLNWVRFTTAADRLPFVIWLAALAVVSCKRPKTGWRADVCAYVFDDYDRAIALLRGHRRGAGQAALRKDLA